MAKPVDVAQPATRRRHEHLWCW